MRDYELVRQILGGRSEAFSELVTRYRDAVCAVAYSYLGNWDDVQDAAQEAFLQAYRRIGQLRHPERVGPWLRQVTANVAIAMLRQRRGNVSLEEAGERAGPRAEASESLTRVVVTQALARLPEQTRITTTLCYIGGYSHAEVAEFLEVPLNTIRSRLQSAKRRLAEEMLAMVQEELHEGKQRVRISYPHLLQTQLVESTGDDARDEFLFRLVNVLQLSLGEQLRAILFSRTFAWEHFVPILLLFREGQWRRGDRRAWSLVVHVMRAAGDRYEVDPTYQGDESPFYDAADEGDPDGYRCTPLLRLIAKESTALLWGEDVRPRIALVSDDGALQEDALEACFVAIKQFHFPRPDGSFAGGETIHYPLSDPKPDQPDRGFGDQLWASMRVFLLARALVLLQTGEYVLDDARVAEAFSRQVGGKWAAFVQSAGRMRYGRLAESERARLHLGLCRRMTAFENWFLTQLRERGAKRAGEIEGL